MEEVMCVICSDALFAEDFVVATSCCHVFHESCLRNWVNRSTTSQTCPECRAACANGNTGFRRLYFKSEPKESFHKQKEKKFQDEIIFLRNQLNQQEQTFKKSLLAETQIRKEMHEKVKKFEECLRSIAKMANDTNSFNAHTSAAGTSGGDAN